MNSSHHALVLAALVMAGCAAPVQSPLPEAASFLPPEDGFLPVTHVSCGRTSPAWAWRVQAPEGTWKVECRGTRGERFSATVGFPDGKELMLPSEAVSVACYQMSNDPELEAWQDDRGRVLLRLYGQLTALMSEGVFAFDGHRLDGWWVRDMLIHHPDSGKQEIYREGVFDGDGRQLVP